MAVTVDRCIPLLGCLLLVAGMGALAVPMASAQPSDTPVLYGVSELSGDRSLAVPDPAWLCVREAAGAGDVTMRHHHGGEEDLVLFLHDEEGATCHTLTGGGTVSLSSGRDVRVLVLRDEPVERHGPGVVRLGGAGAAIRIDDVGRHAEVGVLSDTIGMHTQVVDADTLEVLAEVVDTGEVTLHGTDDDIVGLNVLVVVRDAVVESSVLTRWEDPDWYARNPSIGVVAAVVAAALFLVLWKSRPPQ